jgi:hypothetical protein
MKNLRENKKTLIKYPALHSTDNSGLDMYIKKLPLDPQKTLKGAFIGNRPVGRLKSE